MNASSARGGASAPAVSPFNQKLRKRPECEKMVSGTVSPRPRAAIIRSVLRCPVRYVANMLFQYRVVPDARKRRTCEKRFVVFNAESPDGAFRRALRLGKARQHRYRNVSGGMVYVEFLGLIDLLELDSVCEPDEVWYSMFATTNPHRLIAPASTSPLLP